MKTKFNRLVILPVLCFSLIHLNANNPYQKGNTITLEFNLSVQSFKDSGRVLFSPVTYVGKRTWQQEWKNANKGFMKLRIRSQEPMYINLYDLLVERKNGFWLAEPGDKVKITIDNNRLAFSGVGSQKYALQYQLDSLTRALPLPTNPLDYKVSSLSDYFEWDAYFDLKTKLALNIIDRYHEVISPFAFSQIKATYLDQIIDDRGDKFGALWLFIKSKQMSLDTLCQIYDTSYRKKTESLFEYISSIRYGNTSPISYRLHRQYSFDNNLYPSQEIMSLNFINEVTKFYGYTLRREQFLSQLLPELLQERGSSREIQTFLNRYYAELSYPDYKNYIKKKEQEIREKALLTNTPDFSLSDINGTLYSLKSFKGKFVVLYFWKSGSADKNTLPKIQRDLCYDSSVIFVNIVLDKEKYQMSKIQDNQKCATEINLYTSGEDEIYNITKQYAISQFPSLCIIDPEGKIIKHFSKFYPQKTSSIVETIRKHQAYLKDGPYIIYGPEGTKIYTISDQKVSLFSSTDNKKESIVVQTDQNTTFSVKLKNQHTDELSTYKKPSKMLILSDIEGSFDSFRKLLQANKIIDSKFNWIFGDGHLVLAGDIFDRGRQVTECLWLLYSLEEKAKTDGGYVHLILGNHEIMNLQGKHKYTDLKYFKSAAIIGKHLTELYGEKSELGRWLRSKNIIEKIGEVLVVHGGISPKVGSMPLTIEEINTLARPFYSKPIDSTNEYLTIIYDNNKRTTEHNYPSPFWFRGYYGDIDNLKEIPSLQQVDHSLAKFGVKRIITGHTIVSDTVSLHYNGKIINVDTQHAKGKSEALLIVNKKLYRVNLKGSRKLLITDSD